MKKEPLFLTDKERVVMLEVLAGSPNAALPDSCKPFDVLEANTSDGATEKHVPVVETKGNHVTVKVGSTFHPMTEDHHIVWIGLYTKAGCMQRVSLDLASEPIAHFTLEKGDEPAVAYEYCDLHGLWKTEL